MIERAVKVTPESNPVTQIAYAARRGIRAIFVFRFMSCLLQLATTPILARILSPHEYGVAASIFSIATFVDAIRDTGVTASVIQTPKIDESEVARMWGFGIKRSLKLFLCSLGLLFAGQALSLSKNILPYLALSCFGFCLEGAMSVPSAILARRLKQVEITGLFFASAATTSIVNVGLASWGFGWKAIVIGTFIGNCIRGFGAIAFAKIAKPNLRRSHLPSTIVKLSYAVSWSQIVGFLGGSLVVWVLAFFFSQTVVGAFSRASAVANIPSLVIGSALVSMLGDLYPRISSDKNASRALVGNLLRVLNIVSIFWYVALAYRPNLVTGFILGDKYESAIQFVRAIAFASYFTGIRGSLHNILVARGDRIAVAFFSTFSLIVLLTITLALTHNNAEQTVMYFCLASFINSLPYILRLHLNGAVPVMDLVKSATIPAVLSLVSVILADLMVNPFYMQKNILALVYLSTSLIIYAFATLCIPSYRKQILQYLLEKTAHV